MNFAYTMRAEKMVVHTTWTNPLSLPRFPGLAHGPPRQEHGRNLGHGQREDVVLPAAWYDSHQCPGKGGVNVGAQRLNSSSAPAGVSRVSISARISTLRVWATVNVKGRYGLLTPLSDLSLPKPQNLWAAPSWCGTAPAMTPFLDPIPAIFRGLCQGR